MRPGTPGFVGERLRAARSARGLSAAATAELVGVTRAAISQYEKGHQSPSPKVLASIADRLGLPSHHFLRPILPSERGVVFYRSLSTATKGARTKAEQKYQWVREIVAYVRRFVRLPDVNLPAAEMTPSDPHDIGHQAVEEAAIRARRSWKLGDEPLVNLTGLLEKSGIITTRFSLESEKLDAFSEWCTPEKRPYVILNSDKASAARSRFDAGHELAHLVLHRRVSIAAFRTPSTFSLMEDQANRFSGAFLLPEKTFAHDIHSISLDTFRAIKGKWRVSIGAMIKRAANLQLISQDQERRLWIGYTRRGWRRHEPLDEELAPETPRFLKRSVELLVEKGIVRREEMPFHLALSPSDVVDMLGLDRRFFEEAPQIIFRDDATDVIPFPRPRDEGGA
jgi:Zn-dependent peptidase ImmA (M78 family)/DNA-binding XRE family transcriptional regulator